MEKIINRYVAEYKSVSGKNLVEVVETENGDLFIYLGAKHELKKVRKSDLK